MTDPQTISDAEWEAKIDAAAKRKAPEVYATLPDTEAEAAALAAESDLRAARRKARIEILEADGEKPDDDELESLVEAHKLVKAAARKRDKARQVAADAAITFHLRGLPPRAWNDLQMEHPPTDEQEKRGQMFNPDTFYPALFSACSLRPLPVAKAAAIMHLAGNAGDTGSLMIALREINERGRVSLGKESPSTRS